MSLKQVFLNLGRRAQDFAQAVVVKIRRENVIGAIILSALAVFGFTRTASALSQISNRPTTTDTVSLTPRQKAEKIAKPGANSADDTQASVDSADNTKESSAPAAKTIATTFKIATPRTAAFRATTAQSTDSGASASQLSGAYITIAGVNIPLFSVGSTTANSGNGAASYGRLIYGHRGTAFGNIASLSAGSTFTIVRNGALENYVVAGSTTLDRETTARFMYSLTSQGSYKGRSYSLVLMTCSGAPGDNGDASHRTIVFANRV